MAEVKEKEAEKAAEEPKAREVPEKITWKDDKRAQYARLVLFNAAKGNPKAFGLKAADLTDVNAMTPAQVLTVGKALVGGNYLDGKDGLQFISDHSANGSTTGRALTQSYASEVRPFLRKLVIAEQFGRRGGLTEEEKAAKEKAANEAKEAKAKEREAKKAEREKAAAEKKAAKEKADKEAKAAKDKVDADAKAKADKEAKAGKK